MIFYCRFFTADACFKAVLSVIAELEPGCDTETFLISFVRQLLSTLLVVPDNPERGVLSLVRGLLNVLRTVEWNRAKCTLGFIYVDVVDLFAVMAQDSYPYRVDQG